MAGGAGSVGGSSGMGQQPMGNAYAQPGGGSFGGGYGGSPFGMQQQQPYGMQPMQNPYINSMPGPSSAGGYMGQQMAMSGSPPYGMYQSQQQQGPDQSRVLRMPMGQLGAPNEMAQPMPQQPQQPAYQNNPDYQAYQTQMNDLSRQMDEYVKKAPMYQQLQDLQGKMRGFQQPQGQMGDTGFNRPMPAVMPQQPGPEMMSEMGLYTPETYGNRGGYGGRMGGYGRQMPQQDYGYGQMQNKMREQAQFEQQLRQQYGGLGALQQYLQPPSYRPPVVAPLPLNSGLTRPPPPPPPPPPTGQFDSGGLNIGVF